MNIAIMQPYIFPYIGYFHLINAVDKFVFYDDVNYIKGGWINRNRILLNNRENLFTIPLKGASSFQQINQTQVNQLLYPKWKKKFLISLEQSYKKAPFFKESYHLIQDTLNQPINNDSISDLAIASITSIANYLKLPNVFEKSSTTYPQTKGMEKASRLIEICNINNANTYINPSGGKELYDKSSFKEKGINLFFIKNKLPTYQQFSSTFVPGLSIIDVMMFNSKEDIQEILNHYKLI